MPLKLNRGSFIKSCNPETFWAIHDIRLFNKNLKFIRDGVSGKETFALDTLQFKNYYKNGGKLLDFAFRVN